MLYIRADANDTIASGHIMRCLSIAQALRSLGEESTFIIADMKAVFLLEEKEFSYICLDCDWQDKEGELETLLSVIEKNKIKKILIDSYQITDQYLAKLKKAVTVCYIDDLNISPEFVDVLICYSIIYEQMNYGKGYKGATKLLLGPRYTPLRQEFIDKYHAVKPVAENVLLTTGGSDPCHVSLAFLRECIKRKDMWGLQYHVIVGGFYEPSLKADLVQLQSRYPNIFLYENISNMADVMSICDLAISAGGSTLLELCACGVPTICFAFADNQVESAKYLKNHGVLDYVGDAREEFCGMTEVVRLLVDGINRLINEKSLRKMISAEMKKITDGMGALRIAKELQRL